MSPNMMKKLTIGRHPKIVILMGIVLAVIDIFIVKNQISETPPSTQETIEQQLDRYFKSGQPVFAFIHSTNYKSCIDMMQTVDQVYPEFATAVSYTHLRAHETRHDLVCRLL